MKVVLIIIGALLVMVLARFLFLAHQSKTAPTLGLVSAQLAPCKQTTNCVNSMAADVDAIPFSDSSDKAWENMRLTLEAQGGVIEQQSNNYLWATFSSPLFGFVDDVELLMDSDKQQFQIRSASRVGRSDFGANRSRVEAIRRDFVERAL